jgi:hypothetical protein
MISWEVEASRGARLGRRSQHATIKGAAAAVSVIRSCSKRRALSCAAEGREGKGGLAVPPTSLSDIG